MSNSFFSNIFGQQSGPDEPSASVLAEWNKYSGDTAGAPSLFSAPAHITAWTTQCLPYLRGALISNRTSLHVDPTASDRLASRMEEGGASVQTFMTGALARLSTGVQGVGQTVGAGVQT